MSGVSDNTIVERGNGLYNVIDMVSSPDSAFDRLALTPTSGWAFLILSALVVGGSWIAMPVTNHVMKIALIQRMASSQQFADANSARIHEVLRMQDLFQWVNLALAPVLILLTVLLIAASIYIVGLIAGGKTKFRVVWSGVLNILVISSGIGTFVTSVIVVARGTQSVNFVRDIYLSTPSLALLMPNVSQKMLAFLTAVNAFSLWGGWLIYRFMRRIAKVNVPVSAVSLVIFLGIPAIISMFFAR